MQWIVMIYFLIKLESIIIEMALKFMEVSIIANLQKTFLHSKWCLGLMSAQPSEKTMHHFEAGIAKVSPLSL